MQTDTFEIFRIRSPARAKTLELIAPRGTFSPRSFRLKLLTTSHLQGLTFFRPSKVWLWRGTTFKIFERRWEDTRRARDNCSAQPAAAAAGVVPIVSQDLQGFMEWGLN